MNQLSYAEATRLELYFLRLAGSWREMTATVGPQMVAACTQDVTRPRAHRGERMLAELPATASITRLAAGRLERARASRPRGKAYDDLLWAYMSDLAEVWRNLRDALLPGSRAVWVVGDSAPYGEHIDVPSLLAVLAEELDFEVIDDRVVRWRGERWPGVGGRHAHRLQERLLVMRRRLAGVQQALPGLE